MKKRREPVKIGLRKCLVHSASGKYGGYSMSHTVEWDTSIWPTAARCTRLIVLAVLEFNVGTRRLVVRSQRDLSTSSIAYDLNTCKVLVTWWRRVSRPVPPKSLVVKYRRLTFLAVLDMAVSIHQVKQLQQLHALTSLHHTSPHLTSPHHTTPHHTTPHLTSPHSPSEYFETLLCEYYSPVTGSDDASEALMNLYFQDIPLPSCKLKSQLSLEHCTKGTTFACTHHVCGLLPGRPDGEGVDEPHPLRLLEWHEYVTSSVMTAGVYTPELRRHVHIVELDVVEVTVVVALRPETTTVSPLSPGEICPALCPGPAVAERLDFSPPANANRVRKSGSDPAGSLPDFRTWESCRTMPLVGGFSSGISRFLRHYSILISIAHVGSQDLSSLTFPLPGVYSRNDDLDEEEGEKPLDNDQCCVQDPLLRLELSHDIMGSVHGNLHMGGEIPHEQGSYTCAGKLHMSREFTHEQGIYTWAGKSHMSREVPHEQRSYA
ncbi:hypothetical protein PR048_024178 [Dryococelus australis]|uniref:Uncharacterized protein n=1 Tax=Dryococelus australis TaxID=614101 RepID=A0ABQ9GW62_9NEOP|nr:hypothetical protein PR048_024178 [Dryococelus australis]